MSQLLQQIQNNLQEANRRERAIESAKNTLAGAAIGARAESIKDIKENAPFLEKIFGTGATTQAANKMFVEKNINEYATNVARNMKELRKISPEQFEAEQVEMFAKGMTGDPEVDTQLTLAGQKAIASATAMHYKENYKYQQEQALLAYNGSIASALDRVQASQGDDDALDKAQVALWEAMKRPDIMDEGVHRKTMMQFASARMKAGDRTMHDLLEQEGTVFSAEEVGQRVTDESAYWEAIRRENNVALNVAMGLIEQRIRNGELTTDEAIIAEDVRLSEIYGETAVGGRVITWLNLRRQQGEDAADKQRILELYNKRKWTQLSPQELQWANQVYPEYIKDLVATGKMDAAVGQEHILSRWEETTVINPVLKEHFTSLSRLPVLKDGQINPRYTAMLDEFEQYYQRNPAKAGQFFSDDASYQQVLAIRKAMQSGDAASVEQVVNLYRDPERLKLAEQFIRTTEGKKVLSTVVDNLTSKNYDWSWLIPSDTYWSAAQDDVKLHDMVNESAKSIYLLTGDLDEETLTTAVAAKIQRISEVVAGKHVWNQGKPFAARYGIAASTDEVVQDFLGRHADDMFDGADMDDLMIDINTDQGSIMIMLKDPNTGLGKLDVPEGSMFNRPIPFQAIADQWNSRVKAKALEESALVAEIRQEDLDEMAADLRRAYRSKGITKSDNELKEEALTRMNAVQQQKETFRALLAKGQAEAEGIHKERIEELQKQFKEIVDFSRVGPFWEEKRDALWRDMKKLWLRMKP